MCGDLVERRNQVEQGKHPSLAQRVQNLVHARDGQLAEAADLVEFLVVDNVRTPPDFFGITTSGLEYGEVECWIRRAARYWFKVASTSLAKIGLILWGREVTGVLPSGTEISKGTWEQEPKSVLDLEKTSAKSRRTSPSC